ncbi:MAG: hypothetical protein KJO61_07890, partial [Deltaproteobacteria bacterium]|nr:hypothetical protein [Deltaproteobacteria bacterium]
YRDYPMAQNEIGCSLAAEYKSKSTLMKLQVSDVYRKDFRREIYTESADTCYLRFDLFWA